MKLKSLALVVAGLLASNAMACYTVYDRFNRIAYQGEDAPVDMSLHLRDALQRRFPGGHMVFDQTAQCPPLGIGQAARPDGVSAPANTLVMGSGANRKVAVARTVETQVAMPQPEGGIPNTAVMGAGPSSGVVTQRQTVIATNVRQSLTGGAPLLTDKSTAVSLGLPYTQLSGDIVLVPPRARSMAR